MCYTALKIQESTGIWAKVTAKVIPLYPIVLLSLNEKCNTYGV
jgi:hypothetical protein